jgi:hypothetical protein
MSSNWSIKIAKNVRRVRSNTNTKVPVPCELLYDSQFTHSEHPSRSMRDSLIDAWELFLWQFRPIAILPPILLQSFHQHASNDPSSFGLPWHESSKTSRKHDESKF